MRERGTIEIGGKTFTVQQLPTSKAGKLWNRVMRALGPAYLSMAGAATGKSMMDANVSGFSSAVTVLFANLGADEQDTILKGLLEGTFVTMTNDKGVPQQMPLMPVFDELLSWGEAVALAKFAYDVNFKNFWKDLGASGLSVFGAAGSESKGSST